MVALKTSLLTLTLVLLATVAHAEALNIPKGTEITVDGKMGDGEWTDALQVDFIGGETLKIKQDGKYLFPCGVNVNFADVRPENEAIQFRVFERGINRETLACGTSATAVAAASHYLDLTGKGTHFQVTPTQVSQISEKVGRISDYDSLFVEKAGSEWFLEGPVQKVFEGELPIPEWILGDTTPLSSHG